MKKILILIFLLFSVSELFSDDDYADLLPEEYKEDEFPEYLRKIRRAEVIFVGSYPFSLLFTKIGFDLSSYIGSGFERSYAPQIFGGSIKEDPGNAETKKILLTSLYVSGAFAVIDYVIGEIKEKKAEKNGKNNRSN